MSAINLYRAGFTDLVCVVPPGVPISPRSRIDPSQRGKVPGKLGNQGWYGYPFTQHPPSGTDVIAWDSWGANIGLLGDNFPGLDIDSESPALTEFVTQAAFQRWGPAPVRHSRHPRRLLLYKTDTPFPRTAIKVSRGPGSVEHVIEVLGKGRQYVIEGQHPSGVPYVWDECPLEDFGHPIPIINAEEVEAFFDDLQTDLEAKGLTVERVGRSAADADPVPQEDLQAPSQELLASLIQAVPNTDEHFPDRDDYIRFGHAIKGAGGTLDMFLEWAGRWEGGDNDPDVVSRDWDRMHPPYRIGWGWLQLLANQNSDYVMAQDVFEADLEPSEVEPVAGEGTIPFTDEWVVSRILPYVKDDLRYIPSAGGGGWLIWQGHQWVDDPSLIYEMRVREVLRQFCMRLQARGDAAPGKQGKPFHVAAKRYQSSDGINGVTRLLRARVACARTDFDTDTMALNTPGGVVDLRTGEIRDATPEQMCARSTTVGPQAGEMPLWERFLEDLTGGDGELSTFLQKAMGYALTGDVSEKSLWFIWGSNSDTGKSTFITTMDLLFGSYADSVDAGVFISKRAEGNQPSLARLPGVRLVTATEPAAGQFWDEKRIKAITGGDKIEARALYRNPITYRPQFKIAIVGNHAPEIRNVDDAMLRRIQIIPFNRKVNREDQIENLAQRMVEGEGGAILQWLIDGCLQWQAEGLNPPDVVLQRTAAYAEEEDGLGQWLSEECSVGEDHQSTREDLYRSWSYWCRARNEDAGSARTFKRALDSKQATLGLVDCRINGKRGYRGICLTNAEELTL